MDVAARAKLAIAKAIFRVAAGEDGERTSHADLEQLENNAEVLEILERHGLTEERIAALLHDLGPALDAKPRTASRAKRPNIGLG